MSPAKEERDGDDGSEAVQPADREAETTDSDVTKSRRPRDPVLALIYAIKRLIRKIDHLHARLEALPGRVQFGVGVLTFLSSAYFGTAIKRTVDVVAGQILTRLLIGFTRRSPSVQVTVVALVLVIVQVTVVSEKLTKVVEVVESMASEDEAATDGGMETRHVETTGAWARGGAGLGAVFGGFFGVSTIFGGLIFGSIVGNLAEEWKVKRRKRRRLRTKVVEYLLRERVFAPETVEPATVRGWFPANEKGFVVDAIEELLQDDDSPVVHKSDGLALVGDAEAVTYLDRNGGRVPSEFAGPNRPQ